MSITQRREGFRSTNGVGNLQHQTLSTIWWLGLDKFFGGERIPSEKRLGAKFDAIDQCLMVLMDF